MQKMRITTMIILAFFMLIIVAGANAQENKVWTLEECINYALDHNINVKKQYLNVQLQDEVLLQSKLGMLPNFNGFASHGYNWGQRIDPFTNEFATDRVRSNNLFLQGDLNLWSGFRQLNTVRKNKLSFQQAQYNADFFKDDISISVATEYLQTLFYLEFVEIAQNQLDITNQQVERTNKLVEAGTLAKGDLLTIEAQQASEELSLVDAQNNLALAYLNLSQLMELSTPEGMEVEKPELGLLDEPQLYRPETLYTTAVESRPEIKSAEMGVEVSEMDLKIARGNYYPRLSLNGSIGSGYSGANRLGEDPFEYLPQIGVTEAGQAVFPTAPLTGYGAYNPKPFSDQLKDNLNETMNLNLSIPIFNGWVTRSNVAQAKIGIENANLDLELQKNNLYKILQQAYNDALSAYNRHKAAAKKVQATSEAFKYAEQKFNVGLINSVEYNDAKKEYNNALSEQIQAKYDYVFRITVIDFYLGKPLTFQR